ncbi:hypothetical protein PI124_g20944 [Phytophthora idaei]|nr:hypothetical protein PI125_g22622 [Phytophthora idaei]KAG3233994.1 hypothetical protein PI124_g20944 [Phytophthora idaei]
MIEDVFRGPRLMNADAVFKRPKAKLLATTLSEACESKVRGILFVVLVQKCFSAIQNVVIRKKSKNGTDVSQNDVVVVGTF